MSKRRFAVVLLGLLFVLPVVALGQTVAFVDESGAAAAVYPEAGRAYVRVTHAAANVTSGWDTVTVQLTSTRAGDTESLQLTETGPATGVFLGSIQLAPDYGSQTGVLETGTDPNPPYTRDTIQASYTAGSTVTASASMAGSILRFEDAQGRPATAFGRGERLYLRLVAPLGNDPINENAQRVVLQGGNDSETLYLSETGLDTGVYAGWIDSQLGAGNLNNSSMELDLQGGVVTATYQDDDVPTSSQAAVTVGESRTAFVDAQGAPADFYLEGGRAYIQVYYDFLSPYSPDTISVTVTSVNAGDSETVTLQETGPDTHVFTGSVQLIRGNGTPGNSWVETRESGPPYQFDTLSVSFQGAYGLSSDTASTLGSLTSFLDAAGKETSSYVGGETIHLRVEDQNANYPFGVDTVFATVQSLSTQDAENVTLTETGRDTGVFEGAVESQPGGPPVLSNGRLEVNSGESIQAMHTDANGVLASGALATIEYAGISFVDEEGLPTVELLENSIIRVRVLSPGDSTPNGQATIQVQLRSRHAGDAETLTLTQTGPETGVFEGTIRLRPSIASPGDGGLETHNGGPPLYLGDEVTASYATAVALARTTPARVEFLDSFGAVTTRLVAGSPVRVRVTDHSRNSPYTRDTISLDLVGCADGETLYLLETGIDTGVFVGQMATELGNSSDGVLSASPGCEAAAQYGATNLPRTLEARARFAMGTLYFVDAQGNPTDVFLLGTRAWLRLEAPGYNADPFFRDVVYGAQVSSELGQDQVDVALEETGENTGIFMGFVIVGFGSPSPYDERLDTLEAQGPHRFDTLKARLGVSPTEELTDTASTLNYRIWFLDAFGQVTGSYAQGQRVYVRIEDHRYGNPTAFDRTWARVTATSGYNVDVVGIELQETGRNTGIYEGSVTLDTLNPPSADAALQASPGSGLRAVLDDYSSFHSSPAQAVVEFASLEFIDAAGLPTSTVLEDDYARVRLYSGQDNNSPSVAETVAVQISSLYFPDQETVTLTETGPDTGIFEGAIRTRLATAAAPGEVVLDIATSYAPLFLGDELTARYVIYNAKARMTGARVAFLDTFGKESDRLTLGSPVRVRVTDYRRNNPSLRDNHPIDLVGCGDTEVVYLQETGFSTAVYEGTLPSSFHSGPSGDSTLNGFMGCVVEARWIDSARPDRVTALATFGGGSLAFTDAAGNPASAFLQGTRAYLRVESPVSNSNPGSQDSFYGAEVRSDITGDMVNVLLYETGSDTGVFMGSVELLPNIYPSPYNDTLEIGEDPGPPHRFDTLTARALFGPTDEVTATATTLNYRIWFLDAFGQVVDSYPQDARVYVRMEDHRFNNPSVYDSTWARVTSSNGVTVYLELRETGRNTGIFEGSIDLGASPGDTITAVADDTSFAASPARAVIEFAALEFIDEAGLPTAAVLENGRARVRLYSPQDNSSPSDAESVQVQVRSLYGGDLEIMTLTETGVDTGIFEGSLTTRFAASGSTGDGTLDVASSGAPEYLGDTLTVTYVLYSAVARTTGGRVVFLDAFGREITLLPLGAPVRVRVIDHRRNDPLLRDNHPVDLVGCGDTEVLYLQETGFNTGVYEGSLASSLNSGPSGDSTLNGFLGCVVEARWPDLGRPDFLKAQATFGDGSIAFTDAQGNLTSVFLEGTRAYLRVESAVSNSNPGSQDSVYGVRVRSDITGDVVSLSLYETGSDTGVFTGSFELRLGLSSPYNETLEIGEELSPQHRFDTMTASLPLPAGSLTATATTLNYRIWFLDAFGQVTDSYAQGARVYVRMEDHRFNNPIVYDRTWARVASTSGVTVYIELQETGRDTGIFEGSLDLGASPGDTITAVADDTSFAASPARAVIEFAALEFIDEAGLPTAAVLENGRARVRLYSPQDNSSPSDAESVQVQVRSLYGGDLEIMTLTETGVDTGIFEGSLTTRFAASGSTGDGTLDVASSGAPEYLGDTLTVTYVLYSATARTAGGRVVFLDAFGREITMLALGAPVRVRVTDHRRNDPLIRDTHPIDLVGCGDAEVLYLQETGFNTGVYEGAIFNSIYSGSSGDTEFNGFIGCSVEACWLDTGRPGRLTAQATFGGASLAFTDAQGNLTSVFLEGSRAWLRVEAAGANLSPGSQDSLYGVEVLSDITGDRLNVILSETGLDTGVFMGSFELRRGLSSPYNDVLEVGEEFGPPHRFDTLTARLAFSPTDAAVATATTQSYRVWFLNAFGQVTDSYAQDMRAYIRVEDHRADNPSSFDRTSVRVTSTSGDAAYVELLETGRSTGIFEGSVALDSVNLPSGDLVLQAGPGATITAKEDNAFFDAPSAQAVIDFAALEFIDDAGLPAASVLEGGTARVRLYSRQDNLNPSVAESTDVEVRSLYGGDLENVTVTETGANTGVFEGQVQLRYGSPAAPGNGLLETSISGAPEYLNDTLTARYVLYSASVRTVGARVDFVDSFGRKITTLPLGAPVRVRVTDNRANNPSVRDSHPLDLVGCGDNEVLTLQETGFNTGVYEGSLDSSLSGGGSGDSVLSGFIGCTVEARWLDTGRPEPLTAQVAFGGGSLAFTDVQGNLTSVFLNNSRAYVRVESAGSNANPTAQDSLYGVQVESELTGDLVNVEMIETGPDTGVFTGSFVLRNDFSPSPYNNILEIDEDQGPPHRFDTITARLSFSPTDEMTATATTRNYRIWLLDAFGRVTDSYAQGTRVYVRVEDHRHSSPNSTVTINARVTSSSGDTVYVPIQETAPDSRIFEGSVALDSVNPPASDDILQAGPGTTITAVESDGTFEASPAQATIEFGALEFIDDLGLPITEVLEGGAARVRLYSAFDNVNPSMAETVGVQLSSLYGADSEIVFLTETGANTAVFEGSVDLALGPTAQGNGRLETSTSGFPEYQGDHLTVSLSPFSATARTVAAKVDFLGARGEVVTSYPLRSTIRLRIVDQNRNSSGQIDTFQTTIASLGIGDQETITMTETGATTGVFLGSVPSSDNAGVGSFDGTLWGFAGHMVEVVHGSAYRPEPVTAQATFRSSYAPRPVDDTAQTIEEQSVEIPVLDNDYSDINERLYLTGVTQGANGFVTLSQSLRTLIYSPETDFVGTDTFTYFVRNELGDEEAATVTVTVIRANQPPVANPDTMYVDEDSSATFDVLLNDTDPDNDPLTLVELNTPGQHGSVIASSYNYNGVTYTATTHNFNGTDSFIYKISDGHDHFAFGTVTVIVRPVNDAPAAVNDTATVNEDSSVVVNVLANDTDVENDTLSVTAVTQGTNGTVVINTDKTVTYTPAANFSGTDSFTYTVSDGNGGTATAAVSMTVTSANDAPVAVDDAGTVEEDGTVAIAVLANDADPEGDSLTVVSVTQGANGAVVINPNDTVSYTPSTNFTGTDSFTYTIADGNGGGSTATVTLAVTSVNDAPVANNDVGTAAEDGSVDIDVVANDTDVDNDTLTVTSVAQGNGGSASINANGTVKYTPSANFNGSDSFTYTVSDGNGGNAIATVTVTVNADNDAPAATDDSTAVAEDGSVSITVLANDSDPENDTLSVSAVTQGTSGTVAINANGSVMYTPSANFHGSDSFTYTVSDGNGGTDTATVTVSVSSVNDAPVANDDIATVAEDGSTSFSVLGNDSDVDNDSLTVTSVTQGASGAVTINANGTLMYTASANFHGTDSFTYTVSDGKGGTDTAAVTVTVSAVNDPPVANADTAVVAEDGSVNIAVLGNDSDPESDVLTVTAVTQGSFGAVSINPDKTVRYVPSANYNGADSFTYTLSDGNGGSATASVAVTVSAVNDAPVAVNDSASVAAGAAVTVSVLANDSDIDSPSLTITGVAQGAKGSVAINANGTVTYTAGLFSGADSFTYTVSDGAGGTATGTVTVTLLAPARVTTGIQARYDFNEGSGNTVNDTSGVGTPLNLTIGSTSAVTWLPGGLSVNTATAITNNSNATKIINAVRASNALTVEAWITPDSLSLTGPARILLLSKNNAQRNLVFGQSGNRYETQLRTSAGTPSLLSPTGSVTLDLVHVVYTRNSAGQTVYYINGTQVSSGTASGSLSNWATDHKLSLADNWRGDYHLLAVYSRALTASEVQQNFLAGQNAN